MRWNDRKDWADLCNAAEDLVWRVVDAYDARSGVQLNRSSATVWALFLQELGVAGRFRMEYVAANAARGEYNLARLAGTDLALRMQNPAAMAGLVAVAAAAGPAGAHAAEVLALAASMHALGLVKEAA